MGSLPFNWFDIVLFLVLLVGALRGRKRGMSQELIPLLKWICLLLVCGLLYAPVAGVLAQETMLGGLGSAYTAYLGLAFVVAIIFTVISRQLGGKIAGSDAFGKGEYYLGILSGMVRFACVLIFALALLNARQYTSKEVADHNAFVQQNFDHDFFPPVFDIQNQVFRDSLSGPVVKGNLNVLLIRPTVADSKPIKRKELDLPM
ncbi:MAG: hypothetical protein RLY20_1857 [Verrucomicrobiota bacterium]|jgi:uncharacterized membrane protein required for colicin V production